MKLLLSSYLLICLFSVAVISITAPKSVILTYPKNTPDSVLEQGKNAIKETGGIITHEFKLLKGFAAQASAKALDSVNALSTQYLPVIEEDSIVSIDGDLIPGGHTE